MATIMIIEKIVSTLKNIKGIDAVVLGGSRAKGNFTDQSDIDIGIYYREGAELDLEELNRAASELDDTHRTNLVTEIGGWGPWINGGGWLQIDGIATDFILRDYNKVSDVIKDCLEGKVTIYYQPGHPHGFVNSIYAAEAFYCKVLWEKDNIVTKLKDKLIPYPKGIKTGTINTFLWEANFSCAIAYKSAVKGDIVYASGSLYRAASCLTQVLYALNETYIMNEKGALAAASSFKIFPLEFRKRVEDIFSSLTTEPDNIKVLIDKMSAIVNEVEELCKQQ